MVAVVGEGDVRFMEVMHGGEKCVMVAMVERWCC